LVTGRSHVLVASAWDDRPRIVEGHPPKLIHPALLEHARERSKSVENRVADRVTAFSGSMRFVYLHALWFGLWIGLGVESYPTAS
jgi:uncharacterized membrane protein